MSLETNAPINNDTNDGSTAEPASVFDGTKTPIDQTDSTTQVTEPAVAGDEPIDTNETGEAVIPETIEKTDVVPVIDTEELEAKIEATNKIIVNGVAAVQELNEIKQKVPTAPNQLELGKNIGEVEKITDNLGIKEQVITNPNEVVPVVNEIIKEATVAIESAMAENETQQEIKNVIDLNSLEILYKNVGEMIEANTTPDLTKIDLASLTQFLPGTAVVGSIGLNSFIINEGKYKAVYDMLRVIKDLCEVNSVVATASHNNESIINSIKEALNTYKTSPYGSVLDEELQEDTDVKDAEYKKTVGSLATLKTLNILIKDNVVRTESATIAPKELSNLNINKVTQEGIDAVRNSHINSKNLILSITGMVKQAKKIVDEKVVAATEAAAELANIPGAQDVSMTPATAVEKDTPLTETPATEPLDANNTELPNDNTVVPVDPTPETPVEPNPTVPVVNPIVVPAQEDVPVSKDVNGTMCLKLIVSEVESYINTILVKEYRAIEALFNSLK